MQHVFTPYGPKDSSAGSCRSRLNRQWKAICWLAFWFSALVFLCVVVPPPSVFATGGSDDLAALKATQTVVHQIIERLSPCVVRIETIGGAQPVGEEATALLAQREDEPSRGQSPFRDAPGADFKLADGPTTGLIYREDGLILTSSFNFVREPSVISVVLPDGRRLPARLLARDQVRKIALLQVDAEGLPTPTWVESKAVRVGQWAIALGMGFGTEKPAPSIGIVSAVGRMRGHAIQTDSKLSPANYGGPLVDLEGRVMGICVPMSQRPGELAGIELYDSGVGFALASDHVLPIAEQMCGGRSFQRGWLGIVIDPAQPSEAVIQNIADPSPMRLAGGRAGDRIIRIGGREIGHYGDMIRALSMTPAGETVELTVQRGEEVRTLRVTLAPAERIGPLPDLPEPFDPSNPEQKP